MNDYIIIDNFLNDPFDVRDCRALILPFWKKEDHPFPGSLGKFGGYRTEYLHGLDSELYREVESKLLCAIRIMKNFNANLDHISTHYSFQYTDRKFKLPDWHCDQDPPDGMSEVIAGVIYLNQNPPRNSGTILKINGKKKVIENKFNRLLLYDGRIEHTLQRSFGRTKHDSRLILNTFTYF